MPDVKYTLKQLSATRPDRDVSVYKMHGDIEHPADAVISKDDYEAYPLKMGAFVSALRGDLVEKTFLFLGFSFTDPNIDYILSRVRVQYEQHQRHHYSIQRRVAKDAGETDDDFKYRQLKQDYFIRDLKRFSIYTVLVDEFSEVTELLEQLAVNYKRSSVFISGAADEYGTWNPADALSFLHELSRQIASKKNRVITGFGVGVGSAVLNGVLAYLDSAGKTISDEDVVVRPFPQVATGGGVLDAQREQYRKSLIEHAGIAVFVFGNKPDASGHIVLGEGVRKEFDLCIAANVRPLPIGATGFMAEELWKEVLGNFDTFYPAADAAFREEFEKLGDLSKTPSELIAAVLKLIQQLQKL